MYSVIIRHLDYHNYYVFYKTNAPWLFSKHSLDLDGLGEMKTYNSIELSLIQTASCYTTILSYRSCHTKGVIDLTLPPLPEEEYPLPVRSICLNLFRKTLYRLPPLFAEDGRGLRTANISKWLPQKTRH